MTTPLHRPSRPGFTLIELLVVIAIISVLAAMVIPVGTQLKIKASIKQAQTQMEQISTWIESYGTKRSHYPPENPTDPGPADNPAIMPRPPLVYELTGAELTAAGYRTDRGVTFNMPQLTAAFGIRLISNSTVPGSNPDDSPKKQNFAPELGPGAVASLAVNGVPFPVEVLASKIRGPAGFTNVWHYSTGRPGNHNPNSFDLWLDVVLGGKTNRICNWSSKPIKL